MLWPALLLPSAVHGGEPSPRTILSVRYVSSIARGHAVNWSARLLEDRSAIFVGEEGVEQLGTHRYHLADIDFAQIVTAIDNVNLASRDGKGFSSPMSWSLIEIGGFQDGKHRSFTFSIRGADEDLLRFWLVVEKHFGTLDYRCGKEVRGHRSSDACSDSIEMLESMLEQRRKQGMPK